MAYYGKTYINRASYHLFLEADIYLIIMKQSLLWFSCSSLLRKLLIFEGRLRGLLHENMSGMNGEN